MVESLVETSFCPEMLLSRGLANRGGTVEGAFERNDDEESFDRRLGLHVSVTSSQFS